MSELIQALADHWGWMLYSLLGGPLGVVAMGAAIYLKAPGYFLFFIPIAMSLSVVRTRCRHD